MFRLKRPLESQDTKAESDASLLVKKEEISKKPVKIKKKIGKKEKTQDSFYSLSYKLLHKKISFLYPRYANLEEKILKGGLKVPYEAYVSGMVMASLIMTIVGAAIGILISLVIHFNPPEIGYLIPLMTGIAGAQITFMMMRFYAGVNRNTRARKISEELPYFMGYMATLASSGLTLEGVFKAVAREATKEEIVADAKHLIRNVDLLGMDIINAIKDLIKRSPSEPYTELLEGLIATVQSGGDLKEYFLATANVQLEEKKLLLRKMTSSLGIVAEMYTILLVVFPLMAVIMLSIMAIMTPNIAGLSLTTAISLLTYAFVPMFGIMMLVMMDSMVPKR